MIPIDNFWPMMKFPPINLWNAPWITNTKFNRDEKNEKDSKEFWYEKQNCDSRTEELGKDLY